MTSKCLRAAFAVLAFSVPIVAQMPMPRNWQLNCVSPLVCSMSGSVLTVDPTSITGITATGTGYVHVTSGAMDAAAKLINLTAAADVAANQGTTTTLLHGNAAGQASFGAVSLTADVTGVLPAANGGVAAATTAGWWVPIVGELPIATFANAVIASAANVVRAVQVTLNKSLTINKASWWVQANAGDTVDFAIYSADGTTRLVAVGGTVTVGAAAMQTVTTLATSATLPPGVYYFAWTETGTPTATVQVMALPTNANAFLNTQTTKKMVQAGNAATAGTLPTSLGTLTTAVAVSMPMVIFEP